VLATIFAGRLLHVKFLQIAGGAAILWIAGGLFREEPPLEASALHCLGFWKAMWFIIAADVTMSTDNILAVAAIARGDWLLLLIGLGISIPLVVFASSLLAAMMDRFPAIVYIGAALLGRVAGDMFMTDAFTKETLAPGDPLNWSVQAVCTIGVLVVGYWMKRRRRPAPPLP
jgi:YjbE family integral membrane protein